MATMQSSCIILLAGIPEKTPQKNDPVLYTEDQDGFTTPIFTGMSSTNMCLQRNVIHNLAVYQ